MHLHNTNSGNSSKGLSPGKGIGKCIGSFFHSVWMFRHVCSYYPHVHVTTYHMTVPFVDGAFVHIRIHDILSAGNAARSQCYDNFQSQGFVRNYLMKNTSCHDEVWEFDWWVYCEIYSFLSEKAPCEAQTGLWENVGMFKGCFRDLLVDGGHFNFPRIWDHILQ